MRSLGWVVLVCTVSQWQQAGREAPSKQVPAEEAKRGCLPAPAPFPPSPPCSACRHGDRCSRLHNRPTISPTILLHNMYQNPILNAPLGPDGLPMPVDPKKVQEFFEVSAVRSWLSHSELQVWLLGAVASGCVQHICDGGRAACRQAGLPPSLLRPGCTKCPGRCWAPAFDVPRLTACTTACCTA